MQNPIWRWVAGVWTAIHVEDQGAYSIERLETLSTFASDTSRTRVTVILLLTPLPAALITLSIELVQLQDPSKGVDGNGMFWLRGFLFVFMVNFAVLAQARAIILRLPMTNRQLVMFAATTTAGTVASTYALALAIGFPLPFTLLCGSPACSVLLLIYGAVLWRKFLSDNPRERRELWSYVLVVANQLVMTYVYPGYLFVFQQLAPIYLTAATVFMLAIKLAMKI